ncbi:MAG TPA: OB-fold nucleic acid binding domain-containing protein, partial [Jatrophihabitans sp.]|nr:OB-fold nucleic acid binding domain-containing protein [Jatrophihabitans sp.]
MIRTHDAGALRGSDAGQQVTLAGWVATRRDHGGVTFIDLRDRSGVAQVVLREADVAHDLRNEWVIAVTGEVRLRPPGMVNPALPTGEIEVAVQSLEVLNEAAPLPFQLDAHTEVGEEARLKYRYLDLRRPAPSAAIQLRSEVNRAARETLYERGFVEVETP